MSGTEGTPAAAPQLPFATDFSGMDMAACALKQLLREAGRLHQVLVGLCLFEGSQVLTLDILNQRELIGV
jgi:hypothetical protein